MSNLASIKTVIRSTQQTKKITSAMELVAASKMAKTQKIMKQAVPYAEDVRRLMTHIATSTSDEKHAFFEKQQSKDSLYIVISSDRGLCGSLNTLLFKAALERMQKDKSKHVCLIGNKAIQLFNRLDVNAVFTAKQMGERPDGRIVEEMIQEIVKLYMAGTIGKVFLVYNSFVNIMTQDPKVEQILPIKVKEDEQHNNWDYIYEPDAGTLLELVSQQYLNAVVYAALLENIACEQSARMVAMKSATENAQSVIEELNLAYNKARQAVITTELSEIIAGADAIE